MSTLPRLMSLAAAATLGGLLFASCGKSTPAESGGSAGGRAQVVTTVAMIGDVVSQIGGEHVKVENLIGEGVDPHLYKPTASDVKKLQAADIVFYNGLMLEGKMTDIFVKIASTGKPVHAVTDSIREEGGYVMSDEAEHYDPHVWMDVTGWTKAAGDISKSLAKFDPANAAEYTERATSYSAELKKLDDYARASLASIPEKQRVLVTAHDAFNYMARAYGLEVRGIQGISTESEAGLKDINELVDFIVARQIPAVFVESSVPRKAVEALVEGAKAKGHQVKIGGELFSDAMGAAGTYEGSYIGMIDHNVTLITRALGGNAPEKGLNGKLK
jgi:manganese/zinc/iron transport system substrate-binding protein